MKPHILLVGARDCEVGKIHQLGIDITLLQKEHMVTALQLTCAKQIITMNYENSALVEKIAHEINDKNPIDAIISFTEYGLLPAAICAQKLRLPGNAIKPVEFTRDKIKMRALLLNTDLGIKYQECHQIQEVYQFFETIHNKPIILKPSASSGSKGITKITHDSEITLAWQWANSIEKLPFIAEEFLAGPEYSVETISFNGQHEIVAITEKITTSDNHFIEIGHQLPARIAHDIQNQMTEVIIHFLNIIGQKVGPAHTEICYTQDGPKIIESQTRIGGGQIWEMVELVTGIDLVTETVCHLLNLNQSPRKKLYSAAAVRMIAFENRQIHAPVNSDAIAQLPGIIRVDCKINPGDTLGQLNSSDARQGYILAVGENTEEAVINADRGFYELNKHFKFSLNTLNF